MDQITSVESLFFAALERETPAQRADFLKEACGCDSGLLRRVERLLEAHPRVGKFLEGPAGDPEATAGEANRDASGTLVGPYKLLQRIGEGGMGTVYMAEQTEPVRRTVALKIIKAGMDSAPVIARFEAERQALALMDHPNIARVFEAGTTESGSPYFVMELVKGVSITRFCDENQLTLRERLSLFVPVCQAVQHAHQKGIIHRDLKPSNVLVTLYDDKPVPKVIDFGVAKATSQRLTERTLFTEFGSVVGTLEYMSPEQARLNALDVDTRSDVYALGVLLYELLTGSTPLDRTRLGQAALDELLRVIREDEPPLPSTRLSQSGKARAAISAHRRCDPSALDRLLRGDLDWIAMKCLEKDRSRRYESASGLARDLERHLNDEPVEARPPTAGYRLRKYARKHRSRMFIAGICGAAIAMGIVGVIEGYIRALRAEAQARAAAQRASDEARRADDARGSAQDHAKRAEAAAVSFTQINRFLEYEIFDLNASNYRDRENDPRIRAILDRASRQIQSRSAGRPEVEAGLRRVIGSVYLSFRELDQALPHLVVAEEIFRRTLGDRNRETLSALTRLANCRIEMHDAEVSGMLPSVRQGFEEARRSLGWADPVTLGLACVLARLEAQRGRLEEAEKVAREAQEESLRVIGPDEAWWLLEPAWVLSSILGLRTMQAEPDSKARASWLARWESSVRSLIDQSTRLVGEDHPRTLMARSNLVNIELLSGPGKWPEAEEVATKALESGLRAQGLNNPAVNSLQATLAYIKLKRGKADEAERLIRDCVQVGERNLFWPWLRSVYKVVLGECLRAQGKYAEAEPLLVEGFSKFQASAAEVPPTYRFLIPEMISWIVKLYEDLGRPEKALEWRGKLTGISP